jgi:hypothetical protein
MGHSHPIGPRTSGRPSPVAGHQDCPGHRPRASHQRHDPPSDSRGRPRPRPGAWRQPPPRRATRRRRGAGSPPPRGSRLGTPIPAAPAPGCICSSTVPCHCWDARRDPRQGFGIDPDPRPGASVVVQRPDDPRACERLAPVIGAVEVVDVGARPAGDGHHVAGPVGEDQQRVPGCQRDRAPGGILIGAGAVVEEGTDIPGAASIGLRRDERRGIGAPDAPRTSLQ